MLELKPEEWKDIEGYEGIYQISNYGRVKSLDRVSLQGNKIQGIMKKDYDNGAGYKYIDLYNHKGQRKKHSIHRLVGFAFLDNPHNYPTINHKDEVRSNNYYENLEWCSYEYNINYGNRSRRHSESTKGKYTSENCKASKKVVCLTTKEYFNSVKDASVYYKIPNERGRISGFCQKTWKKEFVGTHPDSKEKLTWMYYEEYVYTYGEEGLVHITL